MSVSPKVKGVWQGLWLLHRVRWAPGVGVSVRKLPEGRAEAMPAHSRCLPSAC